MSEGKAEKSAVSNGDGSKEEVAAAAAAAAADSELEKAPTNGNGSQGNSLNWLADVALSKEKRNAAPAKKNGTKDPVTEGSTMNGSDGESELASDDEGGEHFSTLRELLIRPAPKSNSKNADQSSPIAKRQKLETLEDVISCVIERGVDRESSPETAPPTAAAKDSATTGSQESEVAVNVELKHFQRRVDVYKTILTREPLPIRIMLQSESSNIYPDIPHSWVCKGKMLRLHDPSNPSNYKIFQVTIQDPSFSSLSLSLSLDSMANPKRTSWLIEQDQWKRGQPVMVSGVTQLLDQSIWHPESFLRDFGDEKNDLVNCLTGNLVPNQPMRKFWEGFERLTKRLKDDKGQPMLLKLKVTAHLNPTCIPLASHLHPTCIPLASGLN